MESISAIKDIFQNLDSVDGYKVFISEYSGDDRAGVQKLVENAGKKIDAIEKEIRRTYEMKKYERENESFGLLCGIDEVGRGPLAGPVYAAAVILPMDADILYINDSKKLSEKKREELYIEIMNKALAVGIGHVSNERIDEINILQATFEAMTMAVNELSVKPGALLIDAVHIPQLEKYKQISIIKGDAKSISIAAASIIAKVTRDRVMKDYAIKYPEYGFDSNKGYGSAEHIAAIKKYGPCPIHRRSFIGNFI
ncbi:MULTISPECIES: ribonuclease HII [unclassified Butyrivibrio]|uniref:ribonuclease HII n=1 Tax=unclassified Butyrivibrio TaxID=2639466 RepID=UPI0008E955C7|nr:MULTISPECIES: ribonuclease HII [unclassified Butyrivibrio]RKM62668.1 ribonuclease HII [Butyrivibrio sp. XB500-5]SFU45922.1 RNase HII [Butyrivibrio sp. INlla21]